MTTNETVIQNDVTGSVAPDEVAQDELLAGKFKSQDDLVAAYKELEGKLGTAPEENSEGGDQVSTDAPAADAVAPTEFFPSEKTDEMKAAEVDGYGPQLASVFDAAGMDAKAVSAEYHRTGEFPERAYDALEKQGYARNIVDSYLTGTSARAQVNEVTAQADVDEVQGSIGGAEEYAKMMTWASTNITQEEVASYNEAVSNGKASAQFAVEAMHNRFTKKMGSEPSLLGGKPGSVTGEKFNSTAELTAAMKDPRYKTDPAYRDIVAGKLKHSSIFGRA